MIDWYCTEESTLDMIRTHDTSRGKSACSWVMAAGPVDEVNKNDELRDEYVK